MEIILILHNIRSVFNVGSIFRTAEGFGVKKIYLSGYTPSINTGLPHVQKKISNSLHKTALGAEKLIDSEYVDDVEKLINELKKSDVKVIGLEQDTNSTLLPNLDNNLHKIALLLGEEVNGITPELRKLCDELIEIPMFGQKESFNVSVATGIALYQITLPLHNQRQ